MPTLRTTQELQPKQQIISSCLQNNNRQSREYETMKHAMRMMPYLYIFHSFKAMMHVQYRCDFCYSSPINLEIISGRVIYSRYGFYSSGFESKILKTLAELDLGCYQIVQQICDSFSDMFSYNRIHILRFFLNKNKLVLIQLNNK